MQVAAGASLLLGWNELGHRLPVANDVVLGGFLLALGGLASARMLRSVDKDGSFPPAAPFVWALLWWLGIGLGEIHRFAPDDLHAGLGLLYLTATVLMLEGLARMVVLATGSCRVDHSAASAKEDPVMMERAFDEVARALDAGDLVGIFPEGKITADGNINPFRPGITRILNRIPATQPGARGTDGPARVVGQLLLAQGWRRNDEAFPPRHVLAHRTGDGGCRAGGRGLAGKAAGGGFRLAGRLRLGNAGYTGPVRLLVGVVAATHQRRRGSMRKPHGLGFSRIHGEDVGMHIAQNRQMVARGREVLADGQHFDAMGAKVTQGVEDFLVGFA
jgi:hypothetical protein